MLGMSKCYIPVKSHLVRETLIIVTPLIMLICMNYKNSQIGMAIVESNFEIPEGEKK